MNWFPKLIESILTQTRLLSFVENQEAQRENRLRVLTYHRIGKPETESGLLDPTLLSASPEMFEQQMKLLAENYRILSIPDLLLAIETQTPLPPKSVMVTFDDGYRNFLDTAWPILRRYQVPAILFLATGFISSADRLFWWDRLYQGIFTTRVTRLNHPSLGEYSLENNNFRWKTFINLKKKISCLDNNIAMTMVETILHDLDVVPQTKELLLNWDDARYLKAQDCYLASHTSNHPILSRIPNDIALKEIQSGQQDISKEIGVSWPVFAYPSGHSQDISDALLPILRGEGFTLAMTSVQGINVLPKTDLLQLKRIDLSPRLTLPLFRLQLTSVFQLYYTFQGLLSPLL
jgi:peptidoglycan/xylan/chitin deacetylase (PgdA/CDA1 family)